MALSYVTYVTAGAVVDYTFDKGYIEQSHVYVYLDGVLKTLTTDYTWFNATTVRLNSYPGDGITVRIQRSTPNTERLVDFQDAANLTEADLDLNSDQMFYLAQESQDDFNDSAMTLDTDNKWDAESKVIKNVADPTNAQDAATVAYGDANWGGASAIAAAASAAAALASETAAGASETAAAASEAAAAASAADAAASVTTALKSNRIINGDFSVWNRGEFTGVASSGARDYGPDRWFIFGYPGTASWTYDAEKSTPPTLAESGFSSVNAMKITVGTDETSPAVGEYFCFGQVVEGYNIRDLVGNDITLSFWVKASRAGTYCCALKNYTSSQSYVFEYTATTSWTKIEKTISLKAADLTPDGNWNYKELDGLIIDFMLDADVATGTYLTGTTDTWQSGNYGHTANQTQVQSADTFEIALCQLELGAVANSFVRAGITMGGELALCSRYYQNSFYLNTKPVDNVGYNNGAASTVGTSTGRWSIGVDFKTRMRTSPTIAIYNPITGGSSNAGEVRNNIDATSTGALTISSHTGFVLYPSGLDATDANDAMYVHWEAYAEL